MARKTTNTRTLRPASTYEEPASPARSWEPGDDEAEIRFSLTALGEAVVSERAKRGPKFRGFGPCGRIVA